MLASLFAEALYLIGAPIESWVFAIAITTRILDSPLLLSNSI